MQYYLWIGCICRVANLWHWLFLPDEEDLSSQSDNRFAWEAIRGSSWVHCFNADQVDWRSIVTASITVYVLMAFPGVSLAQRPDIRWVHEDLRESGIYCHTYNSLLYVEVGPVNRWPVNIPPENLGSIADIGDIHSLSVSYPGGFPSRDYAFLREVSTVKVLSISYHQDDLNLLMGYIAECRGVKALSLGGGQEVQPEILRKLAKAEDLLELKLTLRQLSDLHVRTLGESLPELIGLRINVGKSELTAAGIAEFKKLTKLQYLEFGGFELPGDQQAEIKRILPGVDLCFTLDCQRGVFMSSKRR